MSPEVDSLLNQLARLTKGMDIPEFRRSKVGWLNQHMAVRNSQHPNFEQARELVTALMKKGIR